MTGKNAIGLFLPRGSDDIYQQVLVDEAKAAVLSTACTLEVFSAEGEFPRQVRDISQVVTDGLVQVVIVMPVKDVGLDALARRAIAYGIGWVVLNRNVDLRELRAVSKGDVLVARVTPDQQEVGRLQAEQAKVFLPAGGFVVCVQGDTMTSAAADRTEGFRDGLEGSGIKTAFISGRWTRDEAEAALTGWLKTTRGYTSPSLVACQSDGMAVGALAALRNRPSEIGDRLPGLAATPVTGCDGVAHFGRRLVDERKLAATIILPLTAAPAAKMAADFLLRGIVPREQEVVLKPEPYPARSAASALRLVHSFRT